jgi:hypothetical protein
MNYTDDERIDANDVPQPDNDNSHWDPNLERRIAERAYELYEQRGGRDGDAFSDWLQAESELRGKTPVIEDQDNPTPTIVDPQEEPAALQYDAAAGGNN